MSLRKSSLDKPVSSYVQAFMSRKWGGVVLSNPTVGECNDDKPVHTPVVRVVMGTFLSQLRKLLGITNTDHIQGAHMEPLRSVAPRLWEIDNLLRMRTLEQLVSAERTLQSLAQLLGEISNIVINDEVGASINSAVRSIHNASEFMSTGRLLEAYETSQKAFQAAESAFMEPSLLALLYFPDDQKYAIYIPLFLPIMFPVVLSLRNLLRWFRGKPIRKEKKD
ncbi:GPI transamidase component PIG-S [Hyposmocoma kahamanoa]|uniref:GPI transamidase component PIG-S n=1 Tax=Hyposmocoma kahamanoa TaxID=1477025 RepID=UPI000E6D824E|nr:GPI transamidase component PIG-S [Hyposmocoma kahamanoa]